MKKILTFAAIGMFGLFVFAGCSKKSSSSSSSGMKATVNGAALSLNTCYFGITNGSLAIYGTNGTSSSLTYPDMILTVTSYTAGSTGTFNFQDTSSNINTWIIGVLDSSTTVGVTAQSGSIVITSASSTVISGSFSFTADDGTKVTGGTFTAKSN